MTTRSNRSNRPNKPNESNRPNKPNQSNKSTDLHSAENLNRSKEPLIVPVADDVVKLARDHIGEPYVLGARAPLTNAVWKGPWDCAEFASWCLYRATGILFGVEPRHDPMRADAFTGYWEQQSRAANAFVPFDQAVAIAGAFLLRAPQTGRGGHIAISDGMGGTVEAHSSERGVTEGQAGGRRWDFGVLVPGLRYFSNAEAVPIKQAGQTLRLTEPMQRGETVRELQAQLNALGFFAGATDGIFGPQTEAAVAAFQEVRGLLVDGEFGPETQKALKNPVK